MRSRASILPLACWRSTERGDPAWNASSRRFRRSSILSCIGSAHGIRRYCAGAPPHAPPARILSRLARVSATTSDPEHVADDIQGVLIVVVLLRRRGRPPLTKPAGLILFLVQLAVPAGAYDSGCCRVEAVGYLMGAGFLLYFGAALALALGVTLFD